MSMGLVVYSVDIQKIRDAFGSNDEKLMAALEEQFEFEFRDDENALERDPKYCDEKWSNKSITDRDAMRHIINGVVDPQVLKETPHKYSSAIRLLTEFYGEQVDSKMFERLPEGKVTRGVDEFFSKYGLEENFSIHRKLLNGRNPMGLDLGASDEEGFVEYTDVKMALQKLEPLNVLGLESGVSYGVISIYSWMKKAEADKNGLMCYCS